MHGYGIALYVHLLALLTATAASTLVHFAESRVRRAATVRDVLGWLGLVRSAARVFPFTLLTLVLSGSYMASGHHGWSWSLGWVRAGAVGSLLLLVQGRILGARGARVGARIAALGPDAPASAAARVADPIIPILSWANTGLALGIVYVMAAKPALAGALGAVLGAAVLGAVYARSRRPRQPALAPSLVT